MPGIELHTDVVGNGSAKESTEESTGGEDGDDEGFTLGGEAGGAVVLCYVAECAQPDVHLLDTWGRVSVLRATTMRLRTADGTSVITEEDTTEGGKGCNNDTSELALGECERGRWRRATTS